MTGDAIEWRPVTSPDLCVSEEELLQQLRIEESELPLALVHAQGLQDVIEQMSGLLLSARELRASFAYTGRIRWMIGPVTAVNSLSWTSGGVEIVPAPDLYRLGPDGLEWTLPGGQPATGDRVEMSIDAGFVEAPPGLRVGLLAAVSHIYDHRDAMEDRRLNEFLLRIVAPYRRRWVA